ncbi:MAG TPA: M48 family metallopeptidase [Nocardioidaceae bacterium]|nr:M48 family metallopeptidase [Nocardioidaceae bacterium]
MSAQARPGLARRPAVLTAIVAAIALIVIAAIFVPWDWVPGGRLSPMPTSKLLSPPEIAKIDNYNTVRRWLGWSAYFVSLAVALLLGFTSWGARLVRRIGGRFWWWIAVPLGALALLVIGRLVMLGFDLALRAENLRYGLTNQSLAGWSADYLKNLLVSWVITSILLLVVVGFARRFPRSWFAWAGGTALVLTLAGSFLYPVVVEPLFNNFTPLKPGPFRQSVFALAQREGVHISGVVVADASRRTTTVNAYVSGFGDTRHVVIYDNLLKDLTPAQARVVIAHELGHAKNRDVLLGTALGAIGAVVAVSVLALLLDTTWLRWRAHVIGADDPAAVAVILALVAAGGFLISPGENAVSRAIEARADRASLHATHAGKTFIDMQRQLTIKSLTDPDPPGLSQFWWGTHPTPDQRAGLPASLKAAGG